MSIEQLSALISISITLGSFVLTAYTTHQNNKHQQEMKDLEFAHADAAERRNHQRQIFENYIHAAGSCVHFGDPNDIHDFGIYSSLALFYAPESLQPKMIQLQQLIDENQYKHRPGSEEAALLNEIILALKTELTQTESSHSARRP